MIFNRILQKENTKRKGWTVVIAGFGINLALGVLYSWGVFASALRASGWTAIQSQIPYMIACAVFAILMVPAGRLQDRFGPKLVLLLASLLTGIGFVFSSFFMTVSGLSIFYGIGFGSAMGFGYAATTPTAVKWFNTARRGLISGIVVSGFGLAGIFVAPFKTLLIEHYGLHRTFLILGFVLFAVIFFLRLIIDNPPDGYIPLSTTNTCQMAKKNIKAVKDYSWQEMIHTHQFYLLWAMFLLGTFAGLLILGQLSNIGQEQAGITPGKATIIVVIYAVFNWFGRIATGFISDKIGRNVTLFLIFLIQAGSFLIFSELTTLFLMIFGTAMVAFSFGGMLASFPALTADYFGLKNMGLNYGMVFTAWGVGGVLGPFLGGLIRDLTGAYQVSYLISAALCLAGAVISLVTRPPK